MRTMAKRFGYEQLFQQASHCGVNVGARDVRVEGEERAWEGAEEWKLERFTDGHRDVALL